MLFESFIVEKCLKLSFFYFKGITLGVLKDRTTEYKLMTQNKITSAADLIEVPNDL